ncbi:hypothetical protein HMPREF0663_12046 [Hoylesella oralis ATCC 33269]|uniref:Peptidase M26 n=2 Tax=Hoylesella oralis TaxID=28134 RepID=E7RTH3_9BACT|nr:hypothetical protein HMPREF0663_12046 [Hoylesella oralis ATCC 33269]SHF62679.1 hypothetical protein SAMN05444288_1121 [Hoylesella oralis]
MSRQASKSHKSRQIITNNYFQTSNFKTQYLIFQFQFNMKHSITIQRLCLFLFVLVLALPAVATNYDREGYEIFRSRETVEKIGKNKEVPTLQKGKVKIWFSGMGIGSSNCKTTSGTGNSAIYEMGFSAFIHVRADDGYAIRWIILRDTEGGADYDKPEGIKRIGSVSPGYQYYFEKNSISNSGISGGNQNNLNDDNNNIVVTQYDATEQTVYIRTHSTLKWGKFKVRDIIVGYVKVPKARYEKDSYDIYTVSKSFMPSLDKGGYDGGSIEYKLNNNDIADVYGDGSLKLKHPGTGVLTATFPSNAKFGKTQCSTKINVMRDNVTFYLKGTENHIFTKGSNAGHALPNAFDFVKTLTASKTDFDKNNSGFSITSNNSDIIRVTDAKAGNLAFGGTTGRATLTFRQEQTDHYDAHSFSQEFIVVRTDENNTVLIKDKNEWDMFAFTVNDLGFNTLNAHLEADINLGTSITMVGTRSGQKYAGTFNGNGHSITMNWTGDNIAPFSLVEGATFMNLRTKGQITTRNEFASGLISEAYASCTISKCVSEVSITCNANKRSGSAGFIKNIKTSAKVTFDDCVSSGTFNGSTSAAKEGWAGFARYNNGECTLNNCLYIGTNNAGNNSYTFTPNAKTKNCYYRDACGEAQGTQITAEQLRNGEVAYQLQKGRNEQVWGQTIGTNNEPRLIAFDNSAKKVYQVNFTYNNEVKASRYANSGKTVSLPTLTAKDLLGTGYNEHHYYTLAFAEGFNENTTVTGDKQVRINLTEKDCYEITSKADWKAFCDLVNGGQNKLDAKLTQNVDLGGDIVQVGTYNKDYGGTFDGQNHTLTLNWNATASDIAPFRRVSGATIKNLRTEGTIKSSHMYIGGLIDEAYGENTVTGCVSNVNITSTFSTNRSGAGGLISYIGSKGSVNITDCLVKGKIDATTEKGKEGIGGFVYANNGACTMNNCLYLGENNATNNTGESHTFANRATITNCYYLNPCGDAQGDRVTAEQLRNGAVAYKLQNGRSELFWGQTLGSDNEPMPTDKIEKRVYKVEFTLNDEVKASRYANKGGHVASLPTAQELLGTDYDARKTYTLTFDGDFSDATTIDANRTVAATVAVSCFNIATKDDWKEFCDLVKNGLDKLNAKMTADVDLGEEIVMVGTNVAYRYSGTFDGQGHTLSIDWHPSSDDIAPFKYVRDATIRNLHVKGKITSGSCWISGLAYGVSGTTTISNCVSDVNITSSYADDFCYASSMIRRIYNSGWVTFNDCLVKGTLNATTDKGREYMGVFVSKQFGKCTLNNCLYAGTNNASKGGYTFAPNPILNNCYYLNPCCNKQGIQITEKQLKNGEVAKMLQGDRKDNSYWAQVLGETPSPYSEADKAKANYVYYNKVNNDWMCDNFVLTDEKPLPIGIDFTAANATYERDFTAEKGTLCLPYELPVSGFKAYILSGGQGSKVYFNEVNDKLEAYKPYLLTANGTLQLGGTNIEVKAFKADALKTTVGTGHSMTGTVDGVDNASAAAANAYILQPDGLFHKVTAGNTAAMVPAYHAYITCPKGSGAKQLSIIFDDETTGIDGVTTDGATDMKNGPVYDLQGRRVADRLDDAARHQLPAGVYIVGGRKVVVK